LNEVFTIPEEINSVYKYNLAAPDTCAIVSGESYEDTTSSIFFEYKPEVVSSKIRTNSHLSKLKRIIENAIRTKYHDIHSTEKRINLINFFYQVVNSFQQGYYLGPNRTNNPDFEKTLISQERNEAHSFFHFRDGRRRMINKKYVISDPQRENSFDLNWTITALNKNKVNIDLLRKTLEYKGRSISHHGEMFVKTSEILEYLESQGVENVIMFDLTCAIIPDNAPLLLIKKANDIGYGGNKNKKTNKSKNKKTNKSKNKKTNNKTNKNKKKFTPLNI
jgi:hypothetical protein